MATFISTVKFTAQGIKNIQKTAERSEAFRATAQKMGVEVQHIFWTLGPFDGLVVFDAPDAETATAAMLKLGSEGNVQTETARAYVAGEIQQILGKFTA